MFQPHPSDGLNRLFSRKPYQGADPATAHFVFVGLDANYDAHLESSALFSRVTEYHEDGVAFWKKHGVHHPFLLREYTGDGRFYHRSFARIGFTPAHARLVSFVELLHVPTVGRNQLGLGDLSEHHLEWLNGIFLEGAAQHIFIPRAAADLMRKTRRFAWLPKEPRRMPEPLDLWHRHGSKAIHSHLHFSVYGKFEQQKSAEIAAMGRLLPPCTG